MADNSWQDKGYGDYFESLEKQLNNKENVKSTNYSNEIKKPIKRKKKKGFYKVFRIRKSVLAIALAVVLTVTTIIITGALKNPQKQEDKPLNSQVITEEKVEKEEKISYKSTENTLDIPLSNDAKSVIIIDKSTNQIVAQRNPHEKAYPASTTKLMTLLVAAEEIKDYNATFTMTYEITDPLFIAEASVAGFLNGEEVSINDLMYGTMLPSGADAAMGLAIMAAGSEENFVELMNKKVKELGLKNTHFTNPTGLHNTENYSSAYDMAIILDAVMQNEMCKEIISTYQYRTAKTPQNPNGILLSNTIFEYMYGNEPETATILGGKTGFVNESGYCIASYGKCNENNNEYIIVTLGNSARWPAFYGQIDLYKQFAK